MNPNKATSSIIMVSLAFAAAMLISSYILAEGGYSRMVTFFLVSAWMVPFFYLIKVKNQKPD